MIFDTPIKFDENELWVLFGFVVLLAIFIYIPRQFPPALTFIILLFTANLGITVDFILAPKYPFNFYDALDTPKYDLFDFIMDTLNYSIYGYLFIHFYDRWHVKGIFHILYLFLWLILSLLLEIFSVKLNVFKYIHWNFAYSSLSYLIIFILYILFLKLGKMAFRQSYTSRPPV
jgi:hypothetical protein